MSKPAVDEKVIPLTTSGGFISYNFLTSAKPMLPSEHQKAINRIANHFSIEAKLHTGFTKTFRGAQNDMRKQRIIVPRFGLPEICNAKFNLADYKISSLLTDGTPPQVPFRWLAEQSANQKLIANHIISNIYNEKNAATGQAGTIVDLETGQGKSFLACYLIAHIQKKAAIIVHSTSLIEQWTGVIKRSLGDTTSIGYYYGGKHQIGDIMIMVVDSATHDEFKFGKQKIPCLEYWRQFGLIIYDECHTYANDTGLQVLRRAQSRYMLGLSATPNQHIMGFDQMVWWHIGPILETKKLIGYSLDEEKSTVTVHQMQYYGHPNFTKKITNEKLGKIDVVNTITMLCNDPHRDQMIISCIIDAMKLNLFTFVFSDRRESLLRLQKKLCETLAQNNAAQDTPLMTNEDEFMRIVGGATNTDLENADIKARVIFTTYQYMGTGKSIIKMNGLIFATPRRRGTQQFIGRILRKGSDMSVTRHIWDIQDMRVSLAGQWRERKKFYDSRKYNILPQKLTYEAFVNIGNVQDPPIDNIDNIVDVDIDDTDDMDISDITSEIPSVSALLDLAKSKSST